MGRISRCALALALAVARAPVGLLAQDAARWTLEPVAVIGGSSVDDLAYAFDNVTDAGVIGSGDGRLLVLDVAGSRVLEYDERGRWVASAGGPGDGPGEFRFPGAIALGPADSLWVFSVGRVTVFGPDGALRTAPTERRTFGRARADRGGFLRALSAEPTGGSGGSFAPTSTQVARFSPEATLEGVVFTGPYPRRVPVSVTVGNHTSSTHAVERYGVTTHWDALTDGTLVVSDTAAYHLRLLGPDGRVRARFGPGQPPRPVTDEDRRRALAEMNAALDRRPEGPFGVSTELRRELIAQTPFAAVVPRVTGVLVDARDRIWVGVAEAGTGTERIDVHAADGSLLARIDDPPGMPVALYGDGLVAFLERDEFDAQQVRVLRVREGGGP